MSDITATPNGVSMGIDIDKPTSIPSGTPSVNPNSGFIESLPEQFRNADWAQSLAKHENPVAEMAKQLDGQLSLVGRKNEGLRLPGEKATAEDWKAFNLSIGVPEAADAYEFKPLENVPENLKDFMQLDSGLVKKMQNAFHAAGVRKGMEDGIVKAFQEFQLETLESSMQNVNNKLEALNQDFAKRHGDKAQDVVNSFKKQYSGLPENQRNLMEALDPSVTVVLADMYHEFSKKYVREGNLHLDVPNVNPAMSQKDYDAKFGELFAATRKYLPGSPEHLKAQSELNALREKGRAEIFKST